MLRTEEGANIQKGWLGPDDSLTCLHLLGWLTPTEHEGLFEQRTTGGRAVVLETAYDLGHTGTIPTQIANILLTGKFELDRLEVGPDPKIIEDQNSLVYQMSSAICVAAA